MVVSLLVAAFFFINKKLDIPSFEIAGYWQLIIGIVITTIGWVTVTLITKPSDADTLASFEQLIFGKKSKFHNIQYKITGFLLGVIGTYSFLFATGYFIYSKTTIGIILSVVSLICAVVIKKIWSKIT